MVVEEPMAEHDASDRGKVAETETGQAPSEIDTRPGAVDKLETGAGSTTVEPEPK